MLRSIPGNVLPRDDRPLQLRIQEVYTVGTLFGEDWETFAGVAAVAFDGAGRIWVERDELEVPRVVVRRIAFP